jgi:hypothetical protein
VVGSVPASAVGKEGAKKMEGMLIMQLSNHGLYQGQVTPIDPGQWLPLSTMGGGSENLYDLWPKVSSNLMKRFDRFGGI